MKGQSTPLQKGLMSEPAQVLTRGGALPVGADIQKRKYLLLIYNM